METRKHSHQIELTVSPAEVFTLLITPSAIRGWWGASRAIVVARPGGVWAAAWGDDEDIPDYVTVFKIKAFEPPRRLFLTNTKYFAKNGSPSFQADLTTEFTIEPKDGGSILQVVQEGFSVDGLTDEIYAVCEKGWCDTFDSIKRFLKQTG